MYEHYKNYAPTSEPRVLLKDIVASRKAREAVENAERERKSHLKHKARMEGFRSWVRSQEYLTQTDQDEMIKSSFSW